MLANCIEGFLANQKTLFHGDPEIEEKARHYASQIKRKQLGRAQESLAAEEATHYEYVDVNSLITIDAKTVGAEVKRYDMALHRTAVLLWENHAAIERL